MGRPLSDDKFATSSRASTETASLSTDSQESSESPAIEVGGYIVEQMLGKGSFGVVSLARSMATGAHVAIKTIDQRFRLAAESEARMLERLRHHSIVRLLEVIERSSGALHLVMEYVDGGTVRQLVDIREKLDEPDAARILYQATDAVAYLHSTGVCHRDLKPENMLLTDGGNRVVLIDFGLSSAVGRETEPGSHSKKNLFKTVGTPQYSAPEVLLSNNAKCNAFSGPPADVWSLGVSLWMMLTGEVPDHGVQLSSGRPAVAAAPATPLTMRVQSSMDLVDRLPDHVTLSARALLSSMRAVSPEDRPSAPAILQSEWLQRYEREGRSIAAAAAATAGTSNGGLQPEQWPRVPWTAPEGASMWSRPRRSSAQGKMASKTGRVGKTCHIGTACNVDRFSHPWMRGRGQPAATEEEEGELEPGMEGRVPKMVEAAATRAARERRRRRSRSTPTAPALAPGPSFGVGKAAKQSNANMVPGYSIRPAPELGPDA